MNFAISSRHGLLRRSNASVTRLSSSNATRRSAGHSNEVPGSLHDESDAKTHRTPTPKAFASPALRAKSLETYRRFAQAFGTDAWLRVAFRSRARAALRWVTG